MDKLIYKLLSYYEPKTKAAILKAMAVGSNGCPRKVLLNNPQQSEVAQIGGCPEARREVFSLKK